MKKIISFILLITFTFQLNTVRVFAEEVNKSLEVSNQGEVKKDLENEVERNSINSTDESGVIDNEGPIFNSVSFSKDTIKVGEKLDILVDIKDELSGVSAVSSTLIIGQDYKYVDFEVTDTPNIYKYTLYITEEMKYSKVIISGLYMYDNVGNYSDVGSEAINASAKVVDENGLSDETAPILNNVIFSSNEVKVGDTLEITFDVEDDLSGVDSIYLSYTYGNHGYGYTVDKDDDNEFKTKIDITEEMMYKKLYIDSIDVIDLAGNRNKIPYSELENYFVNVADENGKLDTEDPKLNSITVNKTSLMPGEELQITVDASDDTGLKSVSIGLNIGYKLENFELSYDENTKKYIYKLDITEDMKYKKIRLNNIELLDKADNSVYISNYEKEHLEDIIITDYNGVIDNEGPIFNSASFSKDTVKVGEKLDILVDIKDDISGVSTVSATLRIGQDYKGIDFEATDTPNIYKYTLDITEDMKYSKVIISGLYMYDNVGNYSEVYSDEINASAKIGDESGKFDTEDPKLNSITVNKISLKPGEELQITVDASDDTELKSVSIGLNIGYKWENFELSYDENTKKYIYKLDITEDMKYKKIRLTSIELLDKADNIVYISNYDKEYLEDIIITDESGVIDNEAPIFNSLSFSKDTIKVGEKLDILVDIKDDISGVSSINSSLRIGEDYKYIDFEATDTPNIYKYTLDITEDMKYSKITISNLYMGDNAGNSNYVYSDKINALAKVADENGIFDETAPTLNNIIFSSNEVKAGDTLEITFDVEDDLSGVYSIDLSYEFGNNGYGYTVYKDDNNEFKTKIKITEEMVYKKLYINHINVNDKSGNIKEIPYNELENYFVNVEDENGKFDTEDPKLNSITVNKTSLIPGEELEITVDASDDIGLDNVIVNLSIDYEWMEIKLNYDDVTGKYSNKIRITEDMKYRKIRLTNIKLLDKADNRVYINNYDKEYLEDIIITDENGRIDDESPVFNSLNFSKDILKVGDKLDILVNVKDELSGIRNVTGNLRIGNNYEYINFEATDKTNIYKYTLDITEDMKYCKVIIDNLNINDNAGNYTYVYRSEINGLAKVVDENGISDETAPVLNSIKLNKSKVKVGEVLEITLKAEDKLSGIDDAYLSYSAGNRRYYVMDMDKYENGEYKFLIDITEDMLYKTIKIDSINIIDRAGNELVCGYSDLFKYKADVIDIKGLMDTAAPKLNKFEVSTKNPKVGDKFEVYVDATDDLSGINNINMNIIIQNYSGEFNDNVTLTYDENIKKYKYSFEILEDMKYKIISFNRVYIEDKAGRFSEYNSDSLEIDNITIADSKGKIDNYSPIFNSINISKEKVKVGESIDIIADVVDNDSGIESVVVNYSKYKGDYNYINLNYDSSIKKYKGTLTAEEDVLYKAYYINSIEIKDNAGNYKKKLFNNPYKLYVTDETNKIDIDLPIIKSISVDKNKADIGDKVKISLEASDTTSGIKKAVYTYYMNYEYHSIELNYNTLTKKYEGEIVVDESMKGKILQPDNLSVVDNVGNYTNKNYWDLKELIIKVAYEESIEDLEGPKFLGISLDKKVAKPGEKIKVSVTASDDISGINRISCYFNGMALDLEYNKVTKKYEGYIEILEYDLYKKVSLYNINLVDNKYNYTYINSYTFGDISFTVADSEGKLDTTKPALTGYSIYKNTFKWNEKPVIKVNYKDDLSGVEAIKIKARNLDGSKVYYGDSSIYERNEDTAYISLYQLSNVLVNERIFIEEITLIDFSGNEATYTSDKNDFSKLTFDKGNVLKEEKVNIKTNNIYVDDEYVTGTTALGNIGLRIYDIYNDKIQIVQVGSSDSNGNFKLKLDPNYPDEEYMIEAYNTKTNEVLGYSNIKVNKSADVIKDGTVDIKDLAEVALHYGKQVQIFGGKSTIIFEEDNIYNSDINSDYYIDIFDLILVSKKM